MVSLLPHLWRLFLQRWTPLIQIMLFMFKNCLLLLMIFNPQAFQTGGPLLVFMRPGQEFSLCKQSMNQPSSYSFYLNLYKKLNLSNIKSFLSLIWLGPLLALPCERLCQCTCFAKCCFLLNISLVQLYIVKKYYIWFRA